MSKRFINQPFKYLLCTAIIGAGMVYLLHNKEKEELPIDPSYEHGIEVLEQFNQQSVDEVLALIEQQQSNRVNPHELENEIDFKSFFKQSVFVGDSLVEAFLAYGYLDSSSVIAKIGARLGTAEEEVVRMAQLNPRFIFLAYGINDLLVYETADQFVESYQGLISKIEQQLPDAAIYITSIFPVRSDVELENPELILTRINAFNEGLKTMCESLELEYLNIGAFVTEEFYEPDGIHVRAPFYPIWMNSVKTVIEGNEELEN